MALQEIPFVVIKKNPLKAKKAAIKTAFFI